MRSLSIFFLLLSLTLLGYVSDARNGPEDYWKSKMNGDPMPKALKDLLNEDFPTEKNKRDHKFLKDFDMKANIIIYHNDVDIYPKRPKPTAKDDHFSETKEEEAQRRKSTVDP
ncbi:unnamed protein product [Withania somnifera]